MNGEPTGLWMPIAVAAGLVTILVIFLTIWATRYRKVPPNQALIVSGRRTRIGKRIVGFRIVTGGATFVIPVLEEARLLSLEPLPASIRTRKIPRPPQGSVQFDAEAQVKVKGEIEAIATAAEHFLSKSPEEIGKTCGLVIEQHLHAAASGPAFENGAIEAEVKRKAGEDLARMGVELLSFSIREARDAVGPE